MYAFAAVASPLIGTSVYHLSPNALWLGCGAVGLIAGALALQAGRLDVRLGVRDGDAHGR
jgi:hypothetical protein